jgi:hypothetical protein
MRFHHTVVLSSSVTCGLLLNATGLVKADGLRQSPPVESLSLRAPSEIRAAEELNVALGVTWERPWEGPLRPFVYLAQNDRVMCVAEPSSEVIGQHEQGIATMPVHVPDDLPAGRYVIMAGIHGAVPVARAELDVLNDRDVPVPLIITTGTFVDKNGVVHRWHINRAHTLVWDGGPYLPVGGMLIPDRNFDTFHAQIDLLARNNVRDVYFNVGSSVQMPHTWETKSDEDIRLFQRCIDYMDEAGVRYGMELSGLQAHGDAFDLMGGGDFDFRVELETGPSLVERNDDRFIKDNRLCIAYEKVNAALYLVSERDTGGVVRYGRAEVGHDDRPGPDGQPRGDNQRLVRVDIGGLAPGSYRVHISPARRKDSWNDNMFFWGEEREKYYDAIRNLYGRVQMGPGFRFFVDVFWNENNMSHGWVPDHAEFRSMHAAWLKERYGTVEKLCEAWAVEDPGMIRDFGQAGNLMPVRSIRDVESGIDWAYLVASDGGDLIRCRNGVGQFLYDVRESIGKQMRDFHIEAANVCKSLHDVPVIFKCFSGMDFWHINDAMTPGGFDGLGMETYGVGEPMLTFMGIITFGECEQATKTTWVLATEIGEGNHQDQAISRNKLFGCTSRLGTMYPIYASLLSGGAKGLFHYYMMPSPGVDRFWDDAVARDPRQLEWLGTFAEIVAHAEKLVDYHPTVYYRFPGLFHPNSGLLFSDPYRDYYNTDTLWWVDPAGKLPNGVWMLPTFHLDVPTDMLFINLENAPSTLRYRDDVEACLRSGRRVTWLGFRRDRGSIPSIDRYYADQFAQADDGVEIQVLSPTPTSRVVARNRQGQVWNLIDGELQIISKSAANQPGWRPDRVVLDGKAHRYDCDAFMEDVLGVEVGQPGKFGEWLSYTTDRERVTVTSLAPVDAKSIQMGDALPAYGLDATGNVVPPAREPHRVTLTWPAEQAGDIHVSWPNGEKVDVNGNRLEVALEPDNLTLISSGHRFKWAPEGLLFDTEGTRATVIARTPKDVPAPSIRMSDDAEPVAEAETDTMIRIEAERPVESNFNLDVFSGLAGLSGGGMLGLATTCLPPAPDGYAASWTFKVEQQGRYRLRVREGYLSMASPGEWRIDGGDWDAASNRYVPQDIRLVAQYNALEDERMIFAWYDYGEIELEAGEHTLEYRVMEQRPRGLDVNLANTMRYGKLLDCFELVRIDKEAAADGAASSRLRVPAGALNLIVNPSMEEDVGGWGAAEEIEGRWQWFELRDDHGWDRDLWWTRRVPAQGRIRIEGLMDLGGLQVRQSYAGVRSLRIRAGGPGRRFSSIPVAVEPDELITFGGYVRTDDLDGDAFLHVRFQDARGELAGGVRGRGVHGTTHWELIERGGVRVPPEARLAVLSCETQGDGSGTAWFDDVYLYRAE